MPGVLNSDLRTTTEMLMVAMQADMPILLWGPPGRGKSSLMEAIGRSWGESKGVKGGFQVVTYTGTTSDPSDMGFPFLENGIAYRAKTDWAVELIAAAGRDGIAILFLDELTTCSPAMRAAMLQVVLRRVVGATKLPKGVVVVAAANDPEHAPNGTDLDPALANRFLHIDMKKNHLDFIDGAISHWPDPEMLELPAGWQERRDEATGIVCQFIGASPTSLYDVPTDLSKAGKAWASDRTWYDFGITTLAAGIALERNVGTDPLILGLLGAAVGPDKSQIFSTFRRDVQIPDPELLISDPSQVRVFPRGDQTFAMWVAVYQSIVTVPTVPRWDAAWQIIYAIYDQEQKEIATAAAKMLMPKKGSIVGAGTPEGLAQRFGPIFRHLR